MHLNEHYVFYVQQERRMKMFDNYEDYLYSSSKADELIEEMKEKLHELITDEAKEIMVEYRKAKNELSDLNRQITRKREILKIYKKN